MAVKGFIVQAPLLNQGTLTGGEGSVQLTSKLRYLVLLKEKKISVLKEAIRNLLVQGGQSFSSFPFLKYSLSKHLIFFKTYKWEKCVIVIVPSTQSQPYVM
jgi:hypothetical protein